MIPEGTYAAVVIPVDTQHGKMSVQFGPATQNSPFSAALAFEIINGSCSGQKIMAFLYFGESIGKTGKTTYERSIESLRVCGFTGDDLGKFSDQHPEQEVSLTVKHETYTDRNGVTKTTAKVAWVNSPTRGFVIEKQLSPADLRAQASRLKEALKNAPAVVTKKAERQATGSTPAEGTPPGSDDDIPF